MNLKDTFKIYDFKMKSWINCNLHNLGIPLLSAKLYSSPDASLVVVNNQRVYHFDSYNSEDALIYDIQKVPRPDCELRVVCCDYLICYWKNVTKEHTKMFTSLKRLLTFNTALDDITFEF